MSSTDIHVWTNGNRWPVMVRGGGGGREEGGRGEGGDRGAEREGGERGKGRKRKEGRESVSRLFFGGEGSRRKGTVLCEQGRWVWEVLSPPPTSIMDVHIHKCTQVIIENHLGNTSVSV